MYTSHSQLWTEVWILEIQEIIDMSNNALISSDCVKLVCDFKSILKYDCNSGEYKK